MENPHQGSKRAPTAFPLAFYIWVHYAIMLIPSGLLVLAALNIIDVDRSGKVAALIILLLVVTAGLKAKLSRDIQNAVEALVKQSEAVANGTSHEPLRTRFLEINKISWAFSNADRKRQTMLDELNHRGKNMLARVQFIVDRSIRSSSTIEEAASNTNSRLQTIKAVDELLMRHDMRGACIREVLSQELGAYNGRVALSGEDLPLERQIAEWLGLIAHELATNALKYGALSVPEGKIEVVWSLIENDCVLVWSESGGPPPDPRALESAQGFGTTLLTRSIKILGGSCQRRVERDGLRVTLLFPYRKQEL